MSVPTASPPGPTAVATALLAWYDGARRDLPWRAPPGRRPDPYAVWLSEIMLQQTTVRAVAPFYARFLRRWPDVAALAAAGLDEVLEAWSGLGYYARARNLHACARAVAERHGGRFPDTEAGLAALPGIGPYTAAAVAAIAFDRRATPVDGNVERVVARLFAVETPLPAARPELRRLAATLTPAGRPGDFAQATMDLGATVCAPRRPSCGVCPLAGACLARARGLAEALPNRLARPERPTRRGAAFVALRADGHVLLRRRPDKGLLGGMLEAPSGQWREGARAEGPDAAEALARAPLPARWTRLADPVRHTFTHFHLELDVYRAEVGDDARPNGGGDWRWVQVGDLAGAALPSVMRKVLARALGAGKR